jgi:DNA-directed RNA polymerase subunit M/transcription elongation factor TFIIS
MATYLKERRHYEDRYDAITVGVGRREAGSLLRARAEFYKNAKLEDEKEKAKMEFWWNRLYWWLVEVPVLLERWENKNGTISDWMYVDKLLDERLAAARPIFEPRCSHCGKQGMRLRLKELLRRGSGGGQEVLFMFDCGGCGKRSTFWQDGTELESLITPCPKCGSALEMDVKAKGRTMTTTYTCVSCGHEKVEKTRLGEAEKPDPDYERDKKLFCLTDERAATMQAYRQKWQEACSIMDEEMERDSKNDVYDVVSKINIVKIADLIDKLRPAIEAAGFIELRFEKPIIAYEFSIEFSCMDKNSGRTDAQSRAALKKAIVSTLLGTNWRLMSGGISYRLGYLSGRVRAYEDEKDLAELVEKEAKQKSRKKED